MKKSLALASVVIVLAAAVAVVAQLFVNVSFIALNVPAMIGGLFAGGLLWFAFSDYSRKPRFRTRSMRRSTVRTVTPATLPETDAVSLWTYTTRSA